LFADSLAHYTELFQEVPGETKNKKWHRFFMKHQGKMTVFWKVLEGEDNRRVLS